MPKRGIEERINKPRTRSILLVFASPKTPRQAERELSVKRLKLKCLLQEHLIECLNPEARKGRLYIVSEKAKQYLNISCPEVEKCSDWEIIGWIISSPRQRLVILRCVSERKLTSEEVRMRATQFNSNLTRPATKAMLKELVQKNLIDSEIIERTRYYWINEFGTRIKHELAVIAPISPGFSAA